MRTKKQKGEIAPPASLPDAPNPAPRTLEPNQRYEFIKVDLPHGEFIDIGKFTKFARSITVRNPHGIIDANDTWYFWITHEKNDNNIYPIDAGEVMSFDGPFPVDLGLYLYNDSQNDMVAKLIIARTVEDEGAKY